MHGNYVLMQGFSQNMLSQMIQLNGKINVIDILVNFTIYLYRSEDVLSLSV